jgi:flagellar protein FliS
MSRAQAYLSQYRDVGVAGDIANASPHRLVSLLLRGARDRIQLAALAIGRNDIARKANAINRAYGIIEGLRMTLDRDRGGEVATGLDEIYRYSGQRLVEANANNDTGQLREVDGLLQEIETAWLEIPAAAQNSAR